jgi:outer membrane lipoprotein SlyB
MASGLAGAGTTGAAAVGGSGASGTTGSSSTDRVYRITLRMDDGSTQVITQETTPDFRSGDRVNLASGAIQH